MALLVLGIVASYALVFPCVLDYYGSDGSLMIGGAKMPEINAANAGKLQTWLMTQAKLIKVWGCTSVGVDISICTLCESDREKLCINNSGVALPPETREHVSRRASIAEEAVDPGVRDNVWVDDGVH